MLCASSFTVSHSECDSHCQSYMLDYYLSKASMVLNVLLKPSFYIMFSQRILNLGGKESETENF